MRYPFIQKTYKNASNTLASDPSTAACPSSFIIVTISMTTLHLIPVNKAVTLSHHIKTDGIIIFRSSQLNQGSVFDNTCLDLHTDVHDVVLRIGFDHSKDEIVFNARTSAGKWLHQEKIPFGGKLQGKNHTVTVFDHGDNFQILFNGKTGHTFKKQLHGQVSSARYYVAGQTSLFSDPVVAETYNNFAALVVGIN